MNTIVLIEDYRGSFYSRVGNQRTLCTMDTGKVIESFGSLGYNVVRKRFQDIDLTQNWNKVPVVYTSSEDSGSRYKSYIEDIVLALETSGAMILPNFIYLRAHHNKSFMEALRYRLFPEEASSLQSRTFGTYEDLVNADLSSEWPKVIKSAFGAGSTLVAKSDNRMELLRIARKFSLSMSFTETVREYRSRFLWRGYVPRSLHRNKFIVQNFIPGLNGDFKVLKYGSRFYFLSRGLRPGDFRASGSGNFNFELPNDVSASALLDYAKYITDIIGTPLCSLDIGFDGERFHLIEFQCLNFGPLTAEKSLYHHKLVDSKWVKVNENCDLEYVFCDAIVSHLENTLTVGTRIRA